MEKRSRAAEFREAIVPTRRPSYVDIAEGIGRDDPDLLDAIEAVLADDTMQVAAIHRALDSLGIDIGYSGLDRWKKDVRSG